MRFGRAGLYIGFVSNGMFCWPLPCGSSPGASLFGYRKCLAVMLGACPRIGRGRVPGLEGADARRRDAGDVGAHCRGAPTKQMPLPSRNPKGAWGLHGDRCVARRRRCAWTSPPPRALRSPCKPHARDPFEFSDRLLASRRPP